jgi:predicted glycosyltransferase
LSRVWIDIDNPPQVQYLLPFRDAFEQLGHEVMLTARDYGITVGLLEEAGVKFRMFGTQFGASRASTGLGLARRSLAMLPSVARWKPGLLVSSSRSSALVAATLRLPAFIMCDYEHVDLNSYRLLGSSILHPDVIDAAVFRAKGFPERRLVPFHGLKEDLSFARVDVAGAEPEPFELPADLVRVLVRPPATQSHYYVEASGRTTAELLDHIAADESAVMIFSPRYPGQVEEVTRRSWKNAPVVLDRPLPFVSLLKSVDLVVSSGGTMLREAAFLGLPAYSIFQGEQGAVDRHLEETGKLVVLRGPEDFERLRVEKFHGTVSSSANAAAVRELAASIERRADGGHARAA